ncbi:MAG: hypothetical protein U0Z53_12950 [Blastocatellia bacterium]
MQKVQRSDSPQKAHDAQGGRTGRVTPWLSFVLLALFVVKVLCAVSTNTEFLQDKGKDE